MEVITAKSAGFCFGVKRAVEKVYEQIDKGGRIYTYGPIIHNETVVSDLEQRGVRVLDTLEELKSLREGSVVIRSHGVSGEVYDLIEKQGLTCVDATCPFVKKIHKIVEEESKAGKQIIIIGNDSHPEVEGIKGWCQNKAIVVESPEEAENLSLPSDQKVCVVSQTTFNYNKFQELVEKISKKGYDINIVNTICNATEERQTEAAEIAEKVDVMIVIGGTHSSNTRKLFEICKARCEETFLIQTLADLKGRLSPSDKQIGITAGASTPNYIIEEVQNYVRINF
ncbi:MAG: 4-hydroxy-3-methylbut-2-enyl diphosphate reductase [Lachnospiraceae bacterium]|nr:4-hydroxy-3-methylbut-2-enyl diphosphate reductase [Lachnospiraceae bacterium]